MTFKNSFTYKHTLFACYLGYIGQAIINNLPPLLFVLFQDNFNLTEGQLGSLIAINFCVQIAVDLLCAKFLDRIGYRVSSVAAHICGFTGLVSMGLLPLLLPASASFNER